MHKPIGSIFTLVGGGTPSTKDERYWGNGIPWFSSADIDRFGAIKYRKTVTELGVENSTTNIVGQGIVVVVTRVGLGKVALLPCDMCFSQDIQALIPKNTGEVFGPFVFYQLQYIMQSLRYKGQGTTISGITKKQLADVNFYLPVHSEQERIVSKIEELFSKLDASVAELQTAKEKLKVYRQAVLKEAFSTCEEYTKISDVCQHVTDGDHTPPPKADNGIPFIMISNIEKAQINWKSTKYVTEDYYKAIGELRTPRKGDILYTVTGSFGIPVIVDFDRKFCFQRHIALLRPNEKIAQKYLFYVLQTPHVYMQASKRATGTAQKTVGLSVLRNITIPYCSTKKQIGIIEFLEQHLTTCDSIEQTIDTSLQQAEALRQSILKQAFEGELV